MNSLPPQQPDDAARRLEMLRARERRLELELLTVTVDRLTLRRHARIVAALLRNVRRRLEMWS